MELARGYDKFEDFESQLVGGIITFWTLVTDGRWGNRPSNHWTDQSTMTLGARRVELLESCGKDVKMCAIPEKEKLLERL